MTYTALAIGFLVLCAAAGTFMGPRAMRPRVAAAFAAGMVVLQFVVLTGR